MVAQTHTIALAGNPNVGKSTLFNALTGANQHVGNWPGKTVERQEGRFVIQGHEVTIIDLPGTYSLTAYSIEEAITRDFLMDEQPEAVVAVVDASNLERNLYLVAQILEMGLPLVLVLNMSDQAQNRGLTIDKKRLSQILGGIPVVETVGTRSTGLDTLKDTLHSLLDGQGNLSATLIDYGAPLETVIQELHKQIMTHESLAQRYPARWLAVKLLEQDEGVMQRLRAEGYTELITAAETASNRLEAERDDDAETLITDRRYLFIAGVVGQVVQRANTSLDTLSDRIDRVVTHRLWGVPIFLALMWLTFQFTAHVSAPLLDWIDGLFGGPVTNLVLRIMAGLGLTGSWLESLLVDGVIAGVGGVLTFVPVLFFLYLAIAILEDSGYMARAAFVMDHLMRKMGLHGKSFLPMLVGFGCTVPAVYATRTLDDEQDRRLTAFLLPFMSCGARLPVYVVFGTAFFGTASGNLVFAMYGLGILVAILTSLMLTRTLFKGKLQPLFVMELPPYRVPQPKTLFKDIGERIGEFIRSAGTVILAASIGLWFLLAIPAGTGPGGFNTVEMEDSLFGRVSQVMAPVFAPAGFGDWEASGSLVTGLIAKEVIISTMAQIYIGVDDGAEAELPTLGDDIGMALSSLGEALILTGQETLNIVPRTANIVPFIHMPEAEFMGGGEEDDTTSLERALQSTFTPLAAVAFNVFVLLYIPCMATVGAMRQEFGTRWAVYQVIYTTVVAWVAAVMVYQGGLLLGIGAT